MRCLIDTNVAKGNFSGELSQAIEKLADAAKVPADEIIKLSLSHLDKGD